MPPPKENNLTGEPAKKKVKLNISGIYNCELEAAKPKQQSSLLNFFSSSSKKKAETTNRASKSRISSTAPSSNNNSRAIELPTKNDDADDKGNVTKTAQSIAIVSTSIEAVVPKKVPPSSALWQSLHDNFVLIRKPRLRKIKGNDITTNNPTPQHRQKVAAFDLDGTLVRWLSESPGFWPSQLAHYELWNSAVITKMQHLYDHEDYLLVIFTNQGGIQGAHTGKKASLIKAIVDWLESLVQRPLVVVASTKSLKKYKDRSFHKPTPNMWNKIFVPYFGKKSAPFDIKESFFVGDSADDDDPQGGVDKKFAERAGGGLGAFYTPDDYFGPSHQELRKRRLGLGEDGEGEIIVPKVPSAALESRKALLGGYHSLDLSNEERPLPILILLVGVQGSGKSTFCRRVLFGRNDDPHEGNDNDSHGHNNKNNNWVWLSQDTINNGKPGKREKVEEEARTELQKGNSILLDRMHLNPEERQTMIENVVTQDMQSKVQIHVVVLNPSKEIITRRVKNRTNHPGKVEGEKGVRFALQSLDRLVLPTYKEIAGHQVRLISYVSTEYAVTQLALRYRYNTINIVNNETDSRHDGNSEFQMAKSIPISTSVSTSSAISIPTISLGTMKIGRRICTETVQKMVALGFRSIDTAPTYKNEDKIGDALQASSSKSNNIFIIAKIPKRATTTEQVRVEFEKTLEQLNRTSVDLLLLHWPSDVIAQNTLREVWACMEILLKESKCKALGVCNFNEGALTQLLRYCTIPPVLNQVERHPLLPQFSLLEFCARHNIWMQAHTPLGGEKGREEILKHEIIEQVAEETGLTPAQVVIRWNLQQGVLVVTKCSQEGHANEILSCTKDDAKNTNSTLSPKHMKALDSLGNNDKNVRRFIAPPFMYGSKAVYCWGERMPRK
jgi:DNA 3'-phosphatase